MRIIAGLYKGFRLQTFSGRNIRPTPSKVREAVFDILGSNIVNSDFLDLFAGTGAMGIEALSRGAKKATFVEKNRKAILIIRQNLSMIDSTHFYYILHHDIFQAINILSSETKKYDIIFLDPPYLKDYAQKLLIKIDQSQVAKDNSIIMVQHQIKENIQGDFHRLVFLKEKKYGKSALTIFRYQNKYD